MDAFFVSGYRRNPWADGVSAAGALAVCALLLLVLISGMRVTPWHRPTPAETLVTLVPLPLPEPPDPPPPPPPDPLKMLARPSRTPGAPAPLQASPVEAPAATIAPLAPPGPPPALTDGAGGPGIGPGTGTSTGTGGDGNGGNGIAPKPVRLVAASWARRPDAATLRSFYPLRARNAKIDGQVLLACHVLADRRATDCRVLRETPADYGFGTAALGLAASFRLNPPTRNDDADSRVWVVIPVSFGG